MYTIPRIIKYFILIFISVLQLNAQVIHQEEQLTLHRLIDLRTQGSDLDMPKVGLVLSGGGARGIAHVGVFQALEKYNIPIDMIIGTSMGSIVGGFYAAGYSADELEGLAKSIDWNDLFRDETDRENLFLGQKLEKDRFLINIRFEGLSAQVPSSLTSGQKILSVISEKLYNASYQMVYDFDSLKVPFRAVATNLIDGERIIIGQGDLAEAINASATVPLLFSPVIWDDMLLVDGGLKSNLSADVAKALGMDVIIVVDISSPLRTQDELKAPWEIADQVTTIMMQTQYAHQIEIADVVIKPALDEVGSSDFDKIDEMIAAGRAAVDSAIGKINVVLRKNQPPLTGEMYPISGFKLEDQDGKELMPSDFLHAQSGKLISQNEIEDDVHTLMISGNWREVKAELSDSVLYYKVKAHSLPDSIIMSGNQIFPDSILFRYLLSSDTLSNEFNNLISGLKKIRKFYHDHGYVLMDFSGVRFDNGNNLIIGIDEGTVDEIEIEGNVGTTDLVILRDFPFRPGDAYNTDRIKTGIEAIYNTQLFDKVSVNIKRQDGNRILLLKVKEKLYTVVRLGGKAGTERGAQGYMEIGNDNFIGIGSKIALTARYGDSDRQAILSYRMDRIFRSYFTFGAQGYYQWALNPYYKQVNKLGEYIEERSGVKILLGQQLQKLGQMSVELRIENAKDYMAAGQFDNAQSSELRTITIRSITDKRDNIGFTTKGIYNIWYWEAGNEQIFEGQEKFTKASVNLEGYYTYWNDHTFHLRGVIGVGDKTLPFSEYFRLGGPDSFVGFHEYELYGRQTVFANLEYRYKLPWRLLSDTYLGFRYDIGGVWETPDLVMTGEDFFSGRGIWLGIDTALGPLLLTYGDSTVKGGIIYLSLGYDF